MSQILSIIANSNLQNKDRLYEDYEKISQIIGDVKKKTKCIDQNNQNKMQISFYINNENVFTSYKVFITFPNNYPTENATIYLKPCTNQTIITDPWITRTTKNQKFYHYNYKENDFPKVIKNFMLLSQSVSLLMPNDVVGTILRDFDDHKASTINGLDDLQLGYARVFYNFQNSFDEIKKKKEGIIKIQDKNKQLQKNIDQYSKTNLNTLSKVKENIIWSDREKRKFELISEIRKWNEVQKYVKLVILLKLDGLMMKVQEWSSAEFESRNEYVCNYKKQ